MFFLSKNNFSYSSSKMQWEKCFLNGGNLVLSQSGLVLNKKGENELCRSAAKVLTSLLCMGFVSAI